MKIRTASNLAPVTAEQFLTIIDAAKFAGNVSPDTIRRAIREGELRLFKAGRSDSSRSLVSLSDLQRFIREVPFEVIAQRKSKRRPVSSPRESKGTRVSSRA